MVLFYTQSIRKPSLLYVLTLGKRLSVLILKQIHEFIVTAVWFC